MKFFLIAFTVFVSSCGDILCAKGMSEGREVEVEGTHGIARTLRYIVTRKLVILGWLCYAGAFFSLVALLSVAKMTVAIPATAFSFVLDTIGARFVLREHIPWRRWLGVLCVTAGVVLVVKPAAHAPAAPTLARAARPHRAAVEPGKNEARNHQSGANELHQQSASGEILAKP